MFQVNKRRLPFWAAISSRGKWKRKGAYFTVETAYYFIIIAILASLVFGAFFAMLKQSRIEKAQNDCMNLGSAVSHFHYDAGEYPPSLDVLDDAGSSYTITSGENAGKSLEGYGPWVREVGRDPWGHAYQLVSSETDGFVVWCTYNPDSGMYDAAQSGAASVSANVIGYHGR